MFTNSLYAVRNEAVYGGLVPAVAFGKFSVKRDRIRCVEKRGIVLPEYCFPVLFKWTPFLVSPANGCEGNLIVLTAVCFVAAVEVTLYDHKAMILTYPGQKSALSAAEFFRHFLTHAAEAGFDFRRALQGGFDVGQNIFASDVADEIGAVE